MAKSPDLIGASESENGVRRDTRWSEEYDHLPLKQRLKLLYTRNYIPETLPELNSENRRNSNSSVATNHVVVKQDDDDSERLGPARFAREEKIGNSSSQQSDNGEMKDKVTEANQMMSDTVTGEKVNVAGSGSVQHPLSSKNVVSSEVKFSDKSPSGSSGDRLAAIKVKTECPADIFDDLDILPLIQRRGMLLSRQKIELNNSSAKGSSIRLSICAENQKNLISSSELPYQDRSSSPLEHPCQQNRSSNGGNMTIIKEKNTGSFLKKKLSGSDAKVGKHPSFGRATMLNPVIKTEPLEENKTIGNKIPAASLPPNRIALVQYNYNIADDSDADELDHMLLSERMELFSKKVKVPSLKIKGTKSSSKVVSSGLEGQSIVPEAFKGLRGSRKRKRTATDSVETALEEDAPGLLQVLIGKGVSVDEIKLYGQAESDEAIDDLSSDDNFTELESVIAKLFSQRTSLLKLAPLRCGKGEKATYCLACLFSLVEQARYLVFRKWPVEWGWCRDLQSFIFVFKRHNRIVLERPEYGYATYFFELMDSLPVDWQIKRLVIAMKLTSYSRVTLLENKALEVGEDLTEGEAKVLMDYGWIPNTGLGTMLNYRDRVVHDSKNERDTSEWRTKIGKLLVDGYNSGTVVSADLPRKALEYNFIQSPELNLEVSQRKEIKLEVE